MGTVCAGQKVPGKVGGGARQCTGPGPYRILYGKATLNKFLAGFIIMTLRSKTKTLKLNKVNIKAITFY
jgi:hypothetical protein